MIEDGVVHIVGGFEWIDFIHVMGGILAGFLAGLIPGIGNTIMLFMLYPFLMESTLFQILELGAGNLNHLKYERDFHIYDIVEPFRELYKDSPELKKIRYKYF